jgi:hypothetical protein
MRKVLLGTAAVLGVVAIGFVFGPGDIAIKSIQFDLRKIGESVYEAHARSGSWPRRIGDLDGTSYLTMPYRRAALERGAFVVVWHQDLDPNPGANRDRVLAYDNGSLFARFGFVWACRGDLRVERIRTQELAALKGRNP